LGEKKREFLRVEAGSQQETPSQIEEESIVCDGEGKRFIHELWMWIQEDSPQRHDSPKERKKRKIYNCYRNSIHEERRSEASLGKLWRSGSCEKGKLHHQWPAGNEIKRRKGGVKAGVAEGLRRSESHIKKGRVSQAGFLRELNGTRIGLGGGGGGWGGGGLGVGGGSYNKRKDSGKNSDDWLRASRH